MRAIETMKHKAKWEENKNIRASIAAQIELSVMFFNVAEKDANGSLG